MHVQAVTWGDPLESRRIDEMLAYLEARSFVCLCLLLFRFHINKETVLRILTNLVRAGRFRLLTEVPPTEPIYIANRQNLNHQELTEVLSDIEFAVGTLSRAFPGYRRGIPLNEQGIVGEKIKRSLSGAVLILSDLAFVPAHWKDVHLNSTAIVLTLRHVLGEPESIRSFLTLAHELPRGLGQTVAEIKDRLQTFHQVLQQEIEALRAANVSLASALARP